MNITKKINSNMYFYVAFIINSILALIGGSNLESINEYVKYGLYGVSILLLSIYMVIQIKNEKPNYSILEYIVFFVFSIYSIYAGIILKKFFFIMNLLIMLAINRKNIKSTLKIDITIKTIFIMIHVIATIIAMMMGNFQSIFLTTDSRISCTFFFKHYNIFAGIVTWMLIEYIYIRKDMEIKELLLMTMIEIFIYITTTSKTAILIYIIFMILYFGVKNKNYRWVRNCINIFQKIGIEIMAIFSVVTAMIYKYGIPFISWINAKTSGRIYYSTKAIEKYGFNIFPNKSAGDFEYYIDNFYIKSVILYGFLFVIILCILMKLVKKDKYFEEKILLITFAVNLFSEYFEIVIGNAIPLLILGYIINDGKAQKQKNDELVSVIVPVFNVEKYLKSCIESILNQTHNNLELILVDDGSKDNSGNICDEYKIKHKRVIVIHKENGGVSLARNSALEIAKGEYITFVDADDSIKNTYIEDLLEMCKENKCEMAISGFANKQNDNITENKNQIEKRMTSEETLARMLNEKNFYATVWGKIFKRQIIDKIRFNEEYKIGEDLDFVVKVLSQNVMVYINTSLIDYYYNIREDSVTKDKYNEKWEKEIQICNRLIEDVEKRYPNIKEFAEKRYVRINYSCIMKVLKYNYDEKVYMKLRNNIMKVGKYKKYRNFKIIEKIKLWIVINKPELLIKN